MSFHALADLGIFGHDRHSAVRGDANESAGHEGGGRRLRGLRKNFREEFGVQSQQDTATGDGGDAEERATVKECSAHGASL